MFNPKNNLILAPMSTYTSPDGKVSEFDIQHYGSRAYGGFGTIIVGATSVCLDGRISENDLVLTESSFVRGHKQLVKTIRKFRAYAGLQLCHAGWKSKGTSKRLSVTADSFAGKGDSVKATKEDIIDIRDKFIASIKLAQEASYDFVELHCAHGYFLSQMLSSVANTRTDEYGGSYENRTKLIKEIIEEGKKFINIGIQISASELQKKNTDIHDFIKLINELGNSIAYVHISVGGLYKDVHIPWSKKYMIALVKQFKDEVKVPVIGVGFVRTQEDYMDYQNAGIRYVAVGRQALIDPYCAFKILDKEPPRLVRMGNL